MGPDGPLSGPDRDVDALVAAVRDCGARGGRGLPAAQLPPPGPRAAPSEALAHACPTSTSRSRTRSSAPSASTSARPPPRSTRRCRRCWAATCAGLRDRCAQAGVPEPAIMQSNGGLIDLDAAAGTPPGPCSPVRRAAPRARPTSRPAAGTPDALCFDMGGTSCDVCVVDGGRVQEQSAGEIAGRPLALPMVAVHTVGAGGGSIGWRDGGWRAARRSRARRAPTRGRPCYGRGGTEPTVTDANLVLGHLSRRHPAGGRGRRSMRDAAAGGRRAGRAAVDELPDCAAGIIRVANAEMVRALRVVTVQRGIDPARLRAALLRRRRRPARDPDRRRARDRHRRLPPRRRRAVRAWDGRLAAPP